MGDRPTQLMEAIYLGRRRVAPKARMLQLASPPVLGAALIGIDEIGAAPEAARRLRRTLIHRRLASR